MGPVAGALVSGGLDLLGGLFSNNKKKKQEARAKQDAQDALWEQRSYDRDLTNELRNYDAAQLDKARAYDADAPARNIRSQMAGIQEAALTTGFNPLTLLAGANTGSGGSSIGGSSGFASGASIGSTPPLASIDIATGALQDFGDIVTGEVSRRAAANKLEMDLGQLKLDQLRSGVVAFAPSATAAVGDGLPSLGRRAAMVVTPSTKVSFSGVNSPFSDPRLSDPVFLPTGVSGGIGVPDPRLDRGSGSYLFGRRLESTPGWSSANTIENEYGEVAAALYGGAKTVSDVGFTAGGAFYDWRYSNPENKPPKRRPQPAAPVAPFRKRSSQTFRLSGSGTSRY